MLKPVAAIAALYLFSANTPANMTTDDAASHFGSRPGVESISFSPDGNSVAIIAPGDGQGSALYVADVSDGSFKRVTGVDGENQRLDSCDFVSNHRLVCTIYSITDYYGDFVTVSRVIAINDDGSDVKLLSNRDSADAHYAQLYGGGVIDWLPGQDNQILMERNYIPASRTGSRMGNIKEGLGVDSVNTQSLAARAVEYPEDNAVDYVSDGHGNIRIKGLQINDGSTGQDSGVTRYYYRPQGSSSWKLFGEYDRSSRRGMLPVAVDRDLNIAYAYSREGGQKALYKVSLNDSQTKELVLERAGLDIGRLIRIGRSGRVVGASYSSDYSYSVYFDQEIEQLRTALSKALPGLPLIDIVDASDDETRLLIFAGSDQDPGRYYVYDKANKKLIEALLVRPDLENVALAEVKPVTYPAADGTMIPGYLTLPPGSDGKNLPALVLPHGGPEARDYWGFDWLVQFYANRGYAVLQPNFRGSSGYGDSWFQNNGFQSWRTAIGDVNDAGHWLVSSGIANPDKMAIFGWSYGGYAALQSGVMEPGLFKAIIAVAPVTDLQLLKDQARGYSDYALTRDYIGSGQHIVEGSPARHPDSFVAPVLMFHGTKDINVDIAQGRLMEARLKDADKPVQLVEYSGLDHYLEDSASRRDMLERSDRFLEEKLGIAETE